VTAASGNADVRHVPGVQPIMAADFGPTSSVINVNKTKFLITRLK